MQHRSPRALRHPTPNPTCALPALASVRVETLHELRPRTRRPRLTCPSCDCESLNPTSKSRPEQQRGLQPLPLAQARGSGREVAAPASLVFQSSHRLIRPLSPGKVCSAFPVRTSQPGCKKGSRGWAKKVGLAFQGHRGLFLPGICLLKGSPKFQDLWVGSSSRTDSVVIAAILSLECVGVSSAGFRSRGRVSELLPSDTMSVRVCLLSQKPAHHQEDTSCSMLEVSTEASECLVCCGLTTGLLQSGHPEGR